MTERLKPALFMVAISLCGWGQSQPRQHFALTVRQVAQTLSDKGIRTTEDEVSLLAKVVATEPNPALDILSVDPLADKSIDERAETRSRVRMACHLPGRCLPFYAIVKWPEGAVEHAGASSTASIASGLQTLKRSGVFTIRSGEYATLVMDDERAHIRVSVVSLENGVIGQKIRVASPDHKQKYVAEVVSASLLKRSF
jgi:hypothetical protein